MECGYPQKIQSAGLLIQPRNVEDSESSINSTFLRMLKGL